MLKKCAAGMLLFIMMIAVMPGLAQEPTLPEIHRLDTSRLSHMYQGWNNCGPATLTMGLSYYGYPSSEFRDQLPAANYLKPNGEDQNVSPWQMVNYVEQVSTAWNVKAVQRVGGTADLVKRLLVSDFPVIIEEGYEPYDREGNYLGWMGHYLLLMGYDDVHGTFLTYDSYMGSGAGQGIPTPYDHILETWKAFNYRFIVLYPPEREAEVQAILGDYWDEQLAWETALRMAQEAAALNQQDNWAWFNLGEAFSALGQYESATLAYNQAFTIGMPYRTLWYLHGAFEAFYQTGHYDKVLELAAEVQNVTPYIEEANYYRGLVYAAQGKPQDAIYRFNLVLDFNPNFAPALAAKTAVESGTFVAPVTGTAG